MPILKLLYNADNHNAHHIYMSLIILLILSQDENFNKSVHELVRFALWDIFFFLHGDFVNFESFLSILTSALNEQYRDVLRNFRRRKLLV